MMSSTPKSTPAKYAPQQESENGPSPLAGSGPGGHKPSFKSTKLARRARSFKDEFLEKISQMRGPSSSSTGGIRSQSPKGRAAAGFKNNNDQISVECSNHRQHNKSGSDKGKQEFDSLAKQIQVTLKHFRDVVSKNKLEMLPGNGTIVLDTVWHINLLVKSSVSPEPSSTIRSATHRMYQSVARLIKLCDDALMDATSLEEKNVIEVVALVEDAVQNLIALSQEKIAQQNAVYKTMTPRSSYANISVEQQRNSLPDIPLTPRERQILEQTSVCGSAMMVRSSHSTESILRDATPPPPKPPLPVCLMQGASSPPPLPPKMKLRTNNHHIVDFPDHHLILSSSLERMSLHSRSPEDSSSLLSASAGSLDSVLNQSREEEEISALMDQNNDSDIILENDISDIVADANGSCSWDDSAIMNNSESSCASNCHSNELHQQLNHFQYNRLSNTDSGIVSMDSQRNSSCSKRSSQQSTHWVKSTSSHTTSTTTNETVVKCESVVQSRVTKNNNSLLQMQLTADEVDSGLPPAIPQKTRKKHERQPSPYDNVPDNHIGGEVLVTCQMHQSQSQSLSTSTSITSNLDLQDNGKPPPLPPKKKHIMAYMEMFGNCSHSNDQEFMRHSVHMVHGAWTSSPTPSAAPGLPTTQSCSFVHSASSKTSHHQMYSLTLPQPSGEPSPVPSPARSPNLQLAAITNSSVLPPALPPRRSRSSVGKSPPLMPQTNSVPELKTPIEPLPDLLENTPCGVEDDSNKKEPIDDEDLDLMEKITITQHLVLKKPDEEGPDIRGGHIDALVIHATKSSKNDDKDATGFSYQEAFLTTYRTFVSPYDLVLKLIRRYNCFYCQPDKKGKSRESFALLVRVVSDLTVSDLESKLQQKLMDFVQQLIIGGELTLAKALRVKLIEKHNAKELMKEQQKYYSQLGTVTTLTPRNCTLLDFKSEQIAEQMTLLDADLFMKIEIPEVLIWAQEQNEERSPNLTRFTEHFNKMSYWARTRILLADAKDREKYFLKFIKIMKHLRKINNFNSYLALLSALDSAPVRRLEWQKQVQEGLKEYCALIDSSSSFRAYRQALSTASPPCIPYIGLVLQDLTFVHIGNSNLLPNNMINFSKRWQQYNIVENMKTFKKCLSNSSSTYTFKKNERIIQFFEDFDNFIHEDAMWQISESIKPRGGKKATQ